MYIHTSMAYASYHESMRIDTNTCNCYKQVIHIPQLLHVTIMLLPAQVLFKACMIIKLNLGGGDILIPPSPPPPIPPMSSTLLKVQTPLPNHGHDYCSFRHIYNKFLKTRNSSAEIVNYNDASYSHCNPLPVRSNTFPPPSCCG